MDGATKNAPKAGPNFVLMRSVLAFIVGIVMSANVAQADAPSPRVWLAPIKARQGVAGAGILAGKFDEVARGQLKRSTLVEMSDQGIIGPISAGDDDPRIERAERLRVAGKEAFANGDPQTAFKQLRAALELYEAGLASVGKVEAVTETLGYLGATGLAAGFDADAKDYFKRVVAMYPDAEPLDEYSPEAKALFNKEKKRLLRKKRGSLRITTNPPGALIKIDGEEKGKSPLTVSKLVRGYHYIQASHEEAGLAAAVVKTKSSRRAKRLKMTLSQDVGPKAPGKATPEDEAALLDAVHANRLDAKFRLKAEEVGKKTDCRYVVVGAVDAEGNGFVLNGFIYGVKEQAVIALDRFQFRADLASAMIQAARFASEIEKAANAFPMDKALSGGVFVEGADPVPAPAPVHAATPAPVVTPVATTPTPRVTPKAEPKKKPTPVRKTVAPDGTRVTRTSKPTPAEEGRRLSQPTPGPLTGPAASYSSTKWHQTWWFWTAAGVAVAGAGVGAYFLFQEDAPADQYNVQLRWE